VVGGLLGMVVAGLAVNASRGRDRCRHARHGFHRRDRARLSSVFRPLPDAALRHR
jgi:hypothetical protein